MKKLFTMMLVAFAGLTLFASGSAWAAPEGIAITGLIIGQAQMAGKIFRVAHMGYIGPDDILAGLSALEAALTELGYAVPKGAGVKAAQAVFASGLESRLR